jgi:hypothetical protein
MPAATSGGNRWRGHSIAERPRNVRYRTQEVYVVVLWKTLLFGFVWPWFPANALYAVTE